MITPFERFLLLKQALSDVRCVQEWLPDRVILLRPLSPDYPFLLSAESRKELDRIGYVITEDSGTITVKRRRRIHWQSDWLLYGLVAALITTLSMINYWCMYHRYTCAPNHPARPLRSRRTSTSRTSVTCHRSLLPPSPLPPSPPPLPPLSLASLIARPTPIVACQRVVPSA